MVLSATWHRSTGKRTRFTSGTPSSPKRVWPPFFFFSSRRRHTRWTGDWSSDVCSSDLGRRHRLPTLERAADVAVGRLGAARPVRVGEAQVADREAQLVQAPEHPGERSGGVLVDDQLTGVNSAVETP